MRASRSVRFAAMLGMLCCSVLVIVILVSASPATADSASISGQVLADGMPVGGAHVRVRATDNLALTSADGNFVLSGLEEGVELEITAWAEGYYIASTHITPPATGVALSLRRYHTTDHPEYEWADPTPGSSEGACGDCHPMILPQWMGNAHGGAVSNPRFFSLYNGTDAGGDVQAMPGYLTDFPGTAGTCANCHAPGAGIDGYLTSDMNALRDQITAGIHCDYCHKVGGVWLDPATESVYPNTPGAQGQRMLRPPAGDNIFFGPYDDIHDPDTYLPLISKSQFCAPCHQFSFWGTPIYESYNEWMASDYAALGVTCQDCHMPPNGDTMFALAEVGGLEHPADTIPSHLQLGANSEELLQNTTEMSVAAQQMGSKLQVSVTITNTQAGHHVPTDFPGRHLILLVRAKDGQGSELVPVAGPVVPQWGGEYSGLPGKAYAKVLRDVVSGEYPVVSYWKQTLIESDNRIPAFGSDFSTYAFELPASGQVTIEATLLFRRALQSLVDERGWDLGEIVMETAHTSLSVFPALQVYLPTLMR